MFHSYLKITRDKINQLWINYSNGKFGFSIQKQIWIELGGKLGIRCGGDP